MVTDAAIRGLAEHNMDMIFAYLGWADEAGHEHGWMSDEYLQAVRESLGCARRMIDHAPEGCITILLSDHSGHERTHGVDIPEDMTIPVLMHSAATTGVLEKPVSIKDIAPTIAALMKCPAPREWEGHSLI